jgi:hypothetical protein
VVGWSSGSGAPSVVVEARWGCFGSGRGLRRGGWRRINGAPEGGEEARGEGRVPGRRWPARRPGERKVAGGRRRA